MTLQQHWQKLSPREQRSLGFLLALIGVLLVWFVAIAPAWHDIQRAQTEQQRLAEQLSDMQSLQAQAQTARQQTSLPKDESWRVLQGISSKNEGRFVLTQQGDSVLVQIKNVPPQTLAAWLSQARTQGQSTPKETHLSREGEGWSGNLIMRLPSQP